MGSFLELSIVIKSGSIRQDDNIKAERDRAVLRGLKRGILLTLDFFIPTIAKKTGRMRIAFEDAVDKILARFSAAKSSWSISWDDIKSLTASFLAISSPTGKDYSQYHFRSRGFYFQPTTPGTFPMRLSRFKPIAIRNVQNEIAKGLRISGLENQVVFSVG